MPGMAKRLTLKITTAFLFSLRAFLATFCGSVISLNSEFSKNLAYGTRIAYQNQRTFEHVGCMHDSVALPMDVLVVREDCSILGIIGSACRQNAVRNSSLSLKVSIEGSFLAVRWLCLRFPMEAV